MEQKGEKTTVLTYPLVKREVVFQTDENGDPVTDANGDPIEIVVNVFDESGNLVYEDTDITIKKLANDYDLTCPILSHLFDINSAPSRTHLFGTDSDGYDVLARMMYGGRISLMVGFVVVILETLLGTIMGGIAGYFGGWVDNLIMRLVDIFYCIPSMPILIIMGAFMDALKMDPYDRLIWMMAILGFLGWAGVARLVRGQILSLREQEFMVATEATGVRVRKRIFRHLVPNVMPQLIVTATAGLGGVIITESTLSFLGLGVKHPLATWGTMINSITQRNEDMIKYTYIWIPVGLLICLTVIAFNFVGDGLRDAFDPKMKK
ncbi:MAG: ABC transporter permease [Clostridia bacterium]|nr:ABC transporter permease [Oscillospiraceae bacterium]MBQ3763286.1 ABC transporter permease [Clostridia bacterium]